MNFDKEFETVQIILKTECETRGVDAFILAFIKSEKQIRRIFTFLVFQSENYSSKDKEQLKKILFNNKNIYFNDFIEGIDVLLPNSLAEIYGNEYNADLNEIVKIKGERNKIFHGQLTLDGLNRDDLICRVKTIEKWCKTLGENLNNEIGYDGFRPSFEKVNINITLKNLDRVNTFIKYGEFLTKEMKNKT